MTAPRPATSSARVVVVHGYQAAPDRHWFGWLSDRLTEDGFSVAVPALPDSTRPDGRAWLATLRDTVGAVDERTWFVGHSLGCVTVLRYLATLDPGWRAAGLILVAGFDEPLPALPEIDGYLDGSLSAAALARIVDAVPVRRVIRSDDDDFVPAAASDRLAAALHAPVTVLAGAGHFMGSDGVDTLEAVRVLVTPPTVGAARPWQQEADRLARQSVAAGDPAGWFDRLWTLAGAGETTMPWDSRAPHPLLADWTAHRLGDPRPETAVVVGCGLGADAEHVAGLGVRTVAFDVSATAISLVRNRYPGSPVSYRQADLFALPTAWHRAFDVVVDVYTVQALPRDVRGATSRAVGNLVAPGGRLVSIMAALPADGDPRSGPPWPLTRAEIDAIGVDGLTPERVELLESTPAPGPMSWRATYRRSLG